MSELLKERWNRLAFGRKNRSLNEMYEGEEMHESGIPMGLWEISDYEQAIEDWGVREALEYHLNRYSRVHLEMKIEQLREEIAELHRDLTDLQNQYDSSIYPKEQLIWMIEEISKEK